MHSMTHFIKQAMIKRQGTVGNSPEVPSPEVKKKIKAQLKKLKNDADGTSSTHDITSDINPVIEIKPYNKRLGNVRVQSI